MREGLRKRRAVVAQRFEGAQHPAFALRGQLDQRDARIVGRGLALDEAGLGGARAEPYAETEAHIRERRARGLFGRMRFTIAKPEVSCHPERLLAGARSVVSAALCYYAPEPPLEPGEGRLPRYTWRDCYADLRE